VHYIGMAAMRLPAMMEYRWSLVGLSVALAIMISGVALQLAFQVRQAETLVMGSAIPLMPYTGIWAVRFRMADVAFSTQRTV
jgi:NO-binding membrane sensor protein with MHYT domain